MLLSFNSENKKIKIFVIGQCLCRLHTGMEQVLMDDFVVCCDIIVPLDLLGRHRAGIYKDNRFSIGQKMLQHPQKIFKIFARLLKQFVVHSLDFSGAADTDAGILQ